jgi:hypothetical protein
MSVKNIIFLFGLLLAGCGVMNNPDNSKAAVEDGGFDGAANLTLEISKISTDSLVGNMSIVELDSYRIFETLVSTEQFLIDLNSSTQTLADGDLITVESWINNVNKANINYQEENFLFYPILQNEDCGRKDSVEVDDKNATIIIEATTEQCDTAFVYHVLMYKVDKNIENILIKAFDEGNVTILNQAN